MSKTTLHYLRFKNVTKSSRGRLCFHIEALYGTKWFSCEYLLSTLNQRSINLTCRKKSGNKSSVACNATLTVKMKPVLWDQINVTRQTKTKKVYGMNLTDARILSLFDVNNYHGDFLHMHTPKCKNTVTDAGQCCSTLHDLSCYAQPAAGKRKRHGSPPPLTSKRRQIDKTRQAEPGNCNVVNLATQNVYIDAEDAFNIQCLADFPNTTLGMSSLSIILKQSATLADEDLKAYWSTERSSTFMNTSLT